MPLLRDDSGVYTIARRDEKRIKRRPLADDTRRAVMLRPSREHYSAWSAPRANGWAARGRASGEWVQFARDPSPQLRSLSRITPRVVCDDLRGTPQWSKPRQGRPLRRWLLPDPCARVYARSHHGEEIWPIG